MKTSTLDELGNPSAPPGSHDWTVAVMIDVCIKYREAKTKVGTIRNSLGGLKKHKGWKSVSQRDGSEFLSFEHFCGTKESDGGLGIPPWTVRDILAEERANLPLVELKHGGDRKSKEAGSDQADNVSLNHGNQASYLLARLKRDAPAVLSRLECGEYPSVRQAAIAAGIVKVPTPLELFQRAVRRLSDEEQGQAFSWLKEEYGL